LLLKCALAHLAAVFLRLNKTGFYVFNSPATQSEARFIFKAQQQILLNIPVV
jgi:hypothetical protein